MAEQGKAPVRAIYHTDMKKLGARVKEAEQKTEKAAEEIHEIQELLEDLEEASEWQARFEALLAGIKDAGCANDELKSVVNDLVRDIPQGGLTFGFQWGI